MEGDIPTIADKVSDKVVDAYFAQDPGILVSHQIGSFNDLFKTGIQRIFRERNPIRITKNPDESVSDHRRKCVLYLGGYDGSRMYFGKPVIYDENREHVMLPNEARMRNMTYGVTIHYDVVADFYISEPGQPVPTAPTDTTVIEKVLLGRFPIMVMSDLCVLRGMPSRMRYNLGECRNDHGGYFIIDGKEKCIVSQDVFGDNMLYTRAKVNEAYSYAADIRSVSEDASKPVRTLSVRMVAPSSSHDNGQIVVFLPNVRKPVPLFIVMRALGIESDKDIITCCLLDIDREKTYVESFIPCVHDASEIFDQTTALKYIATFTKSKSVPSALEILADYFLPHMGELNFLEKAYFLGHMTFELLKVARGEIAPTNRDSFKYKRVEVAGTLLYSLFREYHALEAREIFKRIDSEHYFKEVKYTNDFQSLITDNVNEAFGARLIEEGFRKAFKGNWGSDAATRRDGIVQDLNRLSFNSALSHIRKVVLPLDDSAKVTGPRWLNSSQWGLVDPVDTPDGGNIGLHKHLAITAFVTYSVGRNLIEDWLRQRTSFVELGDCCYDYLSRTTKIFANGAWLGNTDDPTRTYAYALADRRAGELHPHTSIGWDRSRSSIYFYTDAGRLTRPVFYVDNGVPSYQNQTDDILSGALSWHDMLGGGGLNAVIEYLDTNEEEGALIAMRPENLGKSAYTHLEIHPSLILGVMGNQVVFPENNQLPRNLFACGQMKQAVSLYHSNFQTRIDKMGVVLNYGATPLVKSRFYDKICHEEHPYGENVIVAIMCYGGYNVEDSILFNKASIERGLFNITYYNSYESMEESSKVGGSQVDTVFSNVTADNAMDLRPGFDYSDLDDRGIIKLNTQLDDKRVIIGRRSINLKEPDVAVDASVFPKKGQIGWVDKTFVSEDADGFRLAKVRVRDVRKPAIGDKFCSRCGQKGTVGLVIEERDMPFTAEGIRPDIIINPHALPSRMTIGQLVETLMGKACLFKGGFGDCTAFMNRGEKTRTFGEILLANGYESSGNEILYNGEDGKQMEASVFIGPTYYMRLKHMVKDKINYRARGPRTLLTRQTVQGRANDGGLRIGEMERDAIAAHGACAFLTDSLLTRGDEYFMAVCNLTGMIAVYNPDQNLFLSPQADGPIQFVGNVTDGLNVVNISKHGRSFSVVKIPYALKLLIQELQTMNVQMHVVTDDNVDKLAEMMTASHTFDLNSNNDMRTASTLGIDDKEPTGPHANGWFADINPVSGKTTWKSLIVDEDGNHTEIWDPMQHSGKQPDRFPDKWDNDDIANYNAATGSQLTPADVSLRLHRDQQNGNWTRATTPAWEAAIPEFSRDSDDIDPLNYLPPPENTLPESSRDSDDIDPLDYLPPPENTLSTSSSSLEATNRSDTMDPVKLSLLQDDTEASADISPPRATTSTPLKTTSSNPPPRTTSSKPPPPPRETSSKPPPPPRETSSKPPPPPPRKTSSKPPPPPPRISVLPVETQDSPTPLKVSGQPAGIQETLSPQSDASLITATRAPAVPDVRSSESADTPSSLSSPPQSRRRLRLLTRTPESVSSPQLDTTAPLDRDTAAIPKDSGNSTAVKIVKLDSPS